MSSSKTGPHIKHCTRIALPDTTLPPPPHTNLLPSINDIPTSTVTLKVPLEKRLALLVHSSKVRLGQNSFT